MNTINTNVQKEMQKELDKYLSNSYPSKDYAISMREINTWLLEKAK